MAGTEANIGPASWRPSLLDRATLYVVEEEVMGTAGSYSLYLAGTAGFVAGVGFDVAVDEHTFPDVAEHDTVQAKVDALQASKDKLSSSLDSVKSVGGNVQASCLPPRIDALTAQIAQTRATFPKEYHPHLKGAAEWGSFAVGAALVGVGVARAINYHYDTVVDRFSRKRRQETALLTEMADWPELDSYE